MTEEKLEKLGIKTVSNLLGLELPMLERYDERIYGGMMLEFLRPTTHQGTKDQATKDQEPSSE